MSAESPEPRRTERSWLEAFGIRPSKRRGQNFLLDGNVVREMAARASWTPAAPVLEVGAGGGALTAGLLAREHRVTAVELDAGLVALLEARFAAEIARGQLRVVAGDVLELPLERLIEAPPPRSEARPWLAGNLPYAITTPILLRALAHAARLEGAVFMVQREYGERILARPGEKAYSSLTVRVAAQATARSLIRVGRSAFWPRPGVESIVLELRFPQPTPFPGDLARLERVLRAAFGQRRKTLENALAHGLGLSKEDARRLLARCGCDPTSRGETLSLDAFAALSEALKDRE